MSLLAPLTPAPPFALLDADEKTVKLSDYVGKWVAIYFYPKALTPGCTTQACGLRDKMADLRRLNVEVVGISADSPALLKKFSDSEHLNFPLLSDADHQVAEKYGAWQLKRMYEKEYMGLARVTFLVDPAGIVRHVWPKVDVKTHADDIIAQFSSI